jgi:hypothetical protein
MCRCGCCRSAQPSHSDREAPPKSVVGSREAYLLLKIYREPFFETKRVLERESNRILACALAPLPRNSNLSLDSVAL